MKTFTYFFLIFFCYSCTPVEKNDPICADCSAPYQEALAYLDAGKSDSAFFFFEKAKTCYLDLNDDKNTADCYIQMAITMTEEADYFASQELSLKALSYLDTSDQRQYNLISANYNNLGNASSQLREFQEALNFYDLALKFSAGHANQSVYLNNKAVTLYDSKNYKEALEIYSFLLKDKQLKPRDYARALTNYARTRWRMDPPYNAAKDLYKALQIRKSEQDLWGINSSYTHLAEYYESRNLDSAIYYAKERLDIAKQLKSIYDEINALHMLIRICPEEKSKTLYNDFHLLNDSLQLARAKSKNQFALVRYEVEKSKVHNLQLQKENSEKEFRIQVQQLINIGISILIVALIISVISWTKRRKKRLELEANNRIKASQLKTSRKVHDIVANGIYRVMTEIENREDIDREAILDKLELMYEKSRDISYEAEEEKELEVPYKIKMAELLSSFATEERKILIVGNETEIWASLSDVLKKEIIPILQELMVNMDKHAQAERVLIRFERHKSEFVLHYMDNGVGLPDNFKKGNGMLNTETRINLLNGAVTFVHEKGKGLKLDIKIPLT